MRSRLDEQGKPYAWIAGPMFRNKCMGTLTGAESRGNAKDLDNPRAPLQARSAVIGVTAWRG